LSEIEIFRQTARHRAMVPYTGRFVNLNPQAVKLVLDSGHTVDVAGTSMTPTLERGTRVTVGPTTEDLRPGDIVLILTANEAELVLHRVIRLFTVGGQQFVIHQGDAPTSAFDTCRREAVLGQAVGFPVTPERALPTLDVLDAAALRQFERRRRLSLLYSLGRKVMFRLPGINPALARGLVRMYREYLVR
jgi:peptidase S24-like protein